MNEFLKAPASAATDTRADVSGAYDSYYIKVPKNEYVDLVESRKMLDLFIRILTADMYESGKLDTMRVLLDLPKVE